MFSRCLLGFALLTSVVLGYADDSSSDLPNPDVTGYWLQSTDAGQPQSVIKIIKEPDQYVGRVITGFSLNGEVPPEYCDRCEGDLKGHFIQGMIIMVGLQHDGDGVYDEGRILDPTEGSLYHVKLRLLNDGQSLYVRGYIGIPWFGRSQTWHRIPDSKIDAVVASGYHFKGKPAPHK